MHEIDFLAVGDESKSGDAIAMRFTRPDNGQPAVVVIDGGFAASGDALVELIQTHYGTTFVDLVVCTHPDDDHISGLMTVVAELRVGRLLIHRPSLFGYGASDGVKSAEVEALIKLAQSKGVVIDDDVYAGASYFGGALVVAGPTREFYEQMLNAEVAGVAARLVEKARQAFGAIVTRIQELTSDPGETLVGDHGGTTPRNNGSFILDLQVDGKRLLFTGDAGAPALEAAADTLDALGRSQKAIDMFQFPHHGSRHNLNRDVVNRLVGHPCDTPRGWAFASVAAKCETHPRPSVSNALKRRGYLVGATKGVAIWYHSPDAPSRATYSDPVVPLGWLDEANEDDD